MTFAAKLAKTYEVLSKIITDRERAEMMKQRAKEIMTKKPSGQMSPIHKTKDKYKIVDSVVSKEGVANIIVDIEPTKSNYDAIYKLIEGLHLKYLILDKDDDINSSAVINVGLSYDTEDFTEAEVRSEVKKITDAATHWVENKNKPSFLKLVKSQTTAKVVKNNAKHGWDLGDINPSDFKALLKKLNIKETAKKTDRAWVWEGEGITIYTGNDPLTGKYLSGHREDEIGYLSYVGVEGDADKVKIAVDHLNEFGNFKDESPGRRDFI